MWSGRKACVDPLATCTSTSSSSRALAVPDAVTRLVLFLPTLLHHSFKPAMPVTTPAASTGAVPRSTQGGTIGAAQASLGASGSASSHVYNAPSAGSMSGAGGARRPAPDMVVPFTLPTVQHVEAWSRQQHQAGKGNKRQKRLHSVDLHRQSQSEEENSDQEHAEQTAGGTLLSIEQR